MNFVVISGVIGVAVLFSIVVIISLFCLGQSKDNSSWNFRNRHASGTRKKIKKKSKMCQNTHNETDEQECNIKEMEVKNCPEIMIECSQLNVEVEIHRSPHSSVTSEIHHDLIDTMEHKESKLSRNQKKRFKTKQRTINLKPRDDDIQCNNSILINSTIDVEGPVVESMTNEDDTNISHSGERRCTNKVNKTESINSSQGNENIKSFSSMESDDKILSDDLVDNFNEKDDDDNIYTNGFNNYTNNYNDSEDVLRLEQQNKILEEDLNQKLKDISTIASALKKENDNCVNLDRLCNALKKELTSVILKNDSNERRLSRFELENNRQMSFYENEVNKLTNKINILENDLRTKLDEQESMKNNLEKLHQFMSEKDKHLQMQNIEVSSVKDLLFNKKNDCQDLELQLKSAKMKIKEYESQNQYVHVITQQLNTQIEFLNKDKAKIINEYDLLKEQSQSREQEKDKIISIFQYQLDEFQREKQQSLFCNTEGDYQNVKSPASSREIYSEENVPLGFQLIESSDLTSLINASKQKLKEQSENYDLIISECREKELNLIDQNSMLSDEYSKLKSEFKNHLKEIVILRQSIEDLQTELSRNSETTIEEMRLELEVKSGVLRKTEEILSQLELRLQVTETKSSESLDGSNQENIKLANQLKSQGLLVDSQTKKICELTNLLQSYNHIQNESMFNGVTSEKYSEGPHQM